MVGTGRCGSTLVEEVITRHPEIGFVSNLDDRLSVLNLKGRWNNELYRHVPQALTRKGRLRFAPSEGYRLLARQVSPVVCEPVRDLTEDDASPWLAKRFRDFVHERANTQRKPVFLHKFTGWPRVRFLHKVFPEAKFINVYRDGRAVANSLVQVDWWSGFAGPDSWRWGAIPDALREAWEKSGGSFVALAGIEWILLMDAYEAARSHIPDEAWLDVRYEDAIQTPEPVFSRIFEFAGLTEPSGFSTELQRHRINPGRATAYRDDLTPRELDLLDGILGETLQRYGYV
jgi:hypothetical protein